MEKTRRAKIYVAVKRLILFSGGVESTGLLGYKNPEDVVFTVEDLSPGADITFNYDAVTRITAALQIELKLCQLTVPCDNPQRGYYQLWSILPMASIYITKNPGIGITEVWYGLNLGLGDEITLPSKKFAQLEAGWKLQHPNIPITFPLVHMTKREIWNTIPNHIRPLVRNCTTNVGRGKDINCGVCAKCCELKILPGSCFDTT